MPTRFLAIVSVISFVVVPARGGETKHKVKSTVKEAARTGGHAARDGAQTFGRSVGALFRGGPEAAKKTWKANAARTRANAKAGGAATKRAAHGG